MPEAAGGGGGVLSIATLVGHLVYAIGLIVTVENGFGLYGVAVTMIVQQVVGTLITVPVGFRYLTSAGLRPLDRATAAEFFAYAWRIQVGGIAADPPTTASMGSSSQVAQLAQAMAGTAVSPS